MSGENEVKSPRLLSLDALRGADMICIIGLDAIMAAWAACCPDWSGVQAVAQQFRHCAWEGIHLYDLIFPLFLFISGVSLFFSLHKQLLAGLSRWKITQSLLKRTLILIVLGIVVNGPLSLPCSEWRFASVLGLIGTAGCVAGLLALWLKKFISLVFCCVFLLITIGGLQLSIGELDHSHSINAIIDRMLLPGVLYGGTMDPEGILCVISAISVALIGYLTGFYLHTHRTAPIAALKVLLVTSLVLLTLGYLLHWTFYPAIKSLWTSSFNLIVSGWSLLLLTLAYYAFDIRKWSRLARPFQIIGVNALFIYVAQAVIDFNSIGNRLFNGIINLYPNAQFLLLSLLVLILKWLILAWMFKRKIFVKI